MNDGEKQSTLDEAAEWFFRRDAGPLSFGDEQAFARWLADPENRAAYAEIGGTWDDLARISRHALPASSRRTPWLSVRRRAAAAAVAVVSVVGIGYFLDVPMRLEADGYTSVGEMKTLILADGSKAVLNTDTAISVAYEPNVRRVRLLRGEAVFTVAKDPSRPFLVDAAGGEARALGTEFDVREDGNAATVTVLKSRVGVSYPRGAPLSATVSPDEAVDFSAAGVGAVHKVDAAAETAWLRGKIIFVDRPLGSVIAALNRYYRGRIQITNSSIRNQRVSGVFDTADPVHVVDLLEQSLGLHSTRLTDYLILLHR